MPSNKKKRTPKPRKSRSAAAKSASKPARSKRAGKTKPAKQRPIKKVAVKKTTAKGGSTRKKRRAVNSAREITQEFRGKGLTSAGIESAADFAGLSRAEQADSESVEELVEEGNVFEAGAVAGVEEADDADEKEVHTHEVPEDDVPDEYLEKE